MKKVSTGPIYKYYITSLNSICSCNITFFPKLLGKKTSRIYTLPPLPARHTNDDALTHPASATNDAAPLPL